MPKSNTRTERDDKRGQEGNNDLVSADTVDPLSGKRKLSANECGLKSYEIEGISKDELAVFYQGLSTILAIRLTRIQAEALRIGHLKAFNDAQTVKVSADKDESERLIKFCKARFELLTTERILCAVKCRYQGEQVSEGRWQRMRLIVLRNSIIFDPGFYGPRVSTQSSIFHSKQVSCFVFYFSKNFWGFIDTLCVLVYPATIVSFVSTKMDGVLQSKRMEFSLLPRTCNIVLI